MSLNKRVTITLVAEAETEKMKSVIKQFKDTINVTKRLDSSLGRVTKAYRDHKKALERQAKAYKDGMKAAEKFGRIQRPNIKQMEKMAGAMDKFRTAAKRAAKAREELASASKGALKEGGLAAGIKGAKAYFSIFQRGMSMAITATKRLAMALVAIGIAGIYTFTRLNKEVARIGIVTGFTDDALQNMHNSLIEISSRSVFSAKELGSAMFDIGAMVNNIDPTGLKNLTDLTQKFAIAAGFEDVNTAAQLLITTFNVFGDKTLGGLESREEQTESFAGIMASAANKTNLSLMDIGTAMQFVGGAASVMDHELNNTLAALGMLRDAGLSASIASTSFNMVLTNLSSSSDTAKTMMRRMGFEVLDAEGNFKEITDIVKDFTLAFDNFNFRDKSDEMEVMNEIFGVRGKRAMLLWMEATRMNENAMDDLAESFGDGVDGVNEINKAYEDYMKSPAATIERFQNILENLSTQLGELFMIDPKTGEMRDWVNILMDFAVSEELTDFATDLGTLMGDLADNIMPSLVTAFGDLSPLLLEVMNLVVDLTGDEGFEKMTTAISENGEAILSNLIQPLVDAAPHLENIMSLIGENEGAFRLLGFVIAGVLLPLYPLILALEALLWVMSLLDPVFSGIADVIDYIANISMMAMNVAIDFLMSGLAALMEFIGHLIETSGAIFGNKGWEEMGRKMKESAIEIGGALERERFGIEEPIAEYRPDYATRDDAGTTNNYDIYVQGNFDWEAYNEALEQEGESDGGTPPPGTT